MFMVRVERRGKSSPGDWRQRAAVNSIPEQHRGRTDAMHQGKPSRSQEVA